MKLDPREYLERQGAAFFEVYPPASPNKTESIDCRTSEASTFAIGFARSGEQVIFIDRQHTNYLLLIGRCFGYDDWIEDDFFDTMPADKVIHELAMIRLAERSLNLRRDHLSLAYAILSRRTVLFPRIFSEFLDLLKSRKELSSDREHVVMGLATSFVSGHERAHLEMQWGMQEADPVVKEILHAFSVIYKAITTKAATDRAHEKDTLAVRMDRCLWHVMSNRSLMEEVTADMMSLHTCWQVLRERFQSASNGLIPIFMESVLKCLGASAVLGLFDCFLPAHEPNRLIEVATAYRDLSFVRFEFTLGLAKCLVLKELDGGTLTDELYNDLEEIGNELRPRIFPLLNQELDFITSNELQELEAEGAELRIEEGLENDHHARLACAMSLGWCTPESLQGIAL